MSQKARVENFLTSLEEGVSNKQAWVLFEEAHPEISKSNFDFYRNDATKKGLWTPGVDVQIGAVQLSKPVYEAIPLKETTIDLENIDMSRFTSIPTGTAVDKIASKRNGWMPGTVYILTGESGAGKSTIATNIGDYLKERNFIPAIEATETTERVEAVEFTAGFISCEMDKDDWTEECIDNPRLAASYKPIFMLDYLDAPNYLEVLVEALMKYQYVVLDSFEVVIDQLKEIKGWTSKKAESELINVLRRAATESNAIIIAIQQYTKGGNFVGSNKIKHMLTGMMFVKFDKHGDRYLTFTKNRRGGHMVGKHLYFTKNKVSGRLEFDDTRFENERAIQEFSQAENELMQEEASLFDDEVLKSAKVRQDRREALLLLNTPASVEELEEEMEEEIEEIEDEE